MQKQLYTFLFTIWLSLTWISASLAGKGLSVRFVPDGDTFHLSNGERVRLAGIDAPERGREGRGEQHYAAEAGAFLARVVQGEPLRIEPTGEGRDRYGRIIALVRLPDETLLNRLLVEEGCAYVAFHPDLSQELFETLAAAQRRAMAERRGAWRRVLSMPEADAPCVGNRMSRRFFPPDCPEAGRIHPKNRVFFPSLKEAFLQGYAPARTCTPWPLTKR